MTRPALLAMVGRSTITEAQWRAQVMELAALQGWRVYAVENSTREITRRSGARVRVRNVNAAGVGFPDLVMARRGRLIFAELKRDFRATQGGGHKVTIEQARWITDLEAVPGVEVYVWRPSDIAIVEQVLGVTAGTTLRR